MERCLICGKVIKDDHAFCNECYNKYDKSYLIKLVKKTYQKDSNYCLDNFNNSLKYFESINSFLDYVNKVDFSQYSIKKKGEDDKKLLENLNDYFLKLNLEKTYSGLIYLDTLYLLSRVFSNVQEKDILDNTKIYMEYSLPNLKMERIDYIFAYKDKLILVEMGQSDLLDISLLADKKEKQLNGYWKELKKEFPELKKKDIVLETFVYSSDSKYIDNSIEHLLRMINVHFNTRLPYEILNNPR